MWPTELRALSVESFEIMEGPEFLVLRCQRCGWKAVFSAAGARLEEIIETAQAHQCSAEGEKLMRRGRAEVGG